MVGRPRLPLEFQRRFWAQVRSGWSVAEAAKVVGVSVVSGRRWFGQAGGVNRFPVGPPLGRYLSIDERENLCALSAAGHGVREIACKLGRDPGTISRELRRGATSRGYRPRVAQQKADQARSKPRQTKLATNLRLRREVVAGLRLRLSPEQIAGRLAVEFPDDPEMRVSPETVYQALYVQGRGGLRGELSEHLRTGRSMRKPRRHDGERRGPIPGMVMISQRPPDVEDRAVPGHWEGDLIMGSTVSNSAIGTLVERTTGFILLLHLPDGHGALAVAEAMITKMAELPEQLRLSLTWDQGREMTHHVKIADETGLDIYFCDPHSPWQRGSNENTNGLLRQYFPKGTDLSLHGAGILDNVAAELNARPRKRHAWLTPAEVLNQLLSETNTNHGVA